MKNLLWFLVLGALTAFGAGKDIYGNNITNSTLIGNVDGELTTVGDINALKVETDPTVPSWAKTPEKPVYNAGEVGARPNNWMPSAADVGALPNNQDALVGNPNFSNAVISASGISTEANARASGDAALDAKIDTKQTNLVSGVNIKTINGDSILGSGNIVVQGGGGGGGVDTNTVKAIIESEVGGTNTLVHSLAPATNYTDAASNNLATAIAEKFPHTSPWISGDSIGWSSSYRGFMVNGRLTMMNGFDNIINDGGDTLSDFISGGSWNTREQKFTKTSATSGLAKLGANGVLTTAAEGVDYLKTHQDISGKVNTSGATSIDSGANWNCGPYSIYFSADGIRLIGNIILPDTIYNGEHPPYTSYSFSSFATATSISNDFPIVTNAYTKAEANEASTNAANAVYFANVTGDVENISAPIATNAAASVFAEIADYALTNLVTAAYTLRTSEIGNYETTANFTLTLQFADNGRSGDCLLYVANTDAADHEMSLSPDSYTYVSADLAAAKTLKAATTNLVMFTRVNSTTVLVSKTEVK